MTAWGYTYIKTLCAICKHADYDANLCTRYPERTKITKRTQCGEFEWDWSLRYLSHPIVGLVNSAYRIRKDWEKEYKDRRKWQKLALKRWDEIKALKKRIKETEEP